jgi:hypothetical protein
MEKKFVYYREMVEKYMRSRPKKKTELKIYTPPPQSSFTRGEINAKCKERKICVM